MPAPKNLPQKDFNHFDQNPQIWKIRKDFILSQKTPQRFSSFRPQGKVALFRVLGSRGLKHARGPQSPQTRNKTTLGTRNKIFPRAQNPYQNKTFGIWPVCPRWPGTRNKKILTLSQKDFQDLMISWFVEEIMTLAT